MAGSALCEAAPCGAFEEDLQEDAVHAQVSLQRSGPLLTNRWRDVI